MSLLFSPLRRADAVLKTYQQWLTSISPSRATYGVPSHREISNSSALNSGHNRWSKIRHKKGAADSARSALFSKISNEIYTSIKLAPSTPTADGKPFDPSDPTTNARFAAVLLKAREVGYPKSNVDLAIQKALNPNLSSSNLSPHTYEALLPPSLSLIIECLTTNPNRSISRVKEQLSKAGGRVGSCGFMFERKGLIRVKVGKEEEGNGLGVGRGEDVFERLFEVAVENGAEDVRIGESEDEEGPAEESEPPTYEIITPLTSLSAISTMISQLPSPSFTILASEPAYLPTSPLHLPLSPDEHEDSATTDKERISEETAEKAAGLLAALDEVEDVTRVWTNVIGL